MRVVKSREFRDNQKMYLDLIDNNEQVMIQRGKNKSYIVLPVTDIDRMSVNPELIELVAKAEQEIREGKTTTIRDPKNIWQDIL